MKHDLTKLETRILREFIAGLYAEPGFSDVSPEDLTLDGELTLQQVGGVLTSLQTKGVIFVETPADHQIMGNDYTFIYLDDSAYCYHREWADESGIEFVELPE